MLIGAHVSTAGGLSKAVARGVEYCCEAIQIFPQSPRMWRPTAYTEDDYAEFREAVGPSSIESTLIHAIYLINCASKESEVKRKSQAALEHSLRVGDGIGSAGVVLHAGARKGEPHAASMKRAAKSIRDALDATDECPLLLENTAGTDGPLGRDVGELAELIELAGGGPRLGVCIDCCHLFATGVQAGDEEALAGFVDELDEKVGLDRLVALHVNDSKVPLGANRDRHASMGTGEMGNRGVANFLSEPRFEGLPAVLETAGPSGAGPDREEVNAAKRLRKDGLRRRSRSPA
jgi:deoxyribonuclease IV